MPGEPPESGCWDWAGGTNKGYGELQWTVEGQNKSILAHRVSYSIFNGVPIPPPSVKVLHSCDRPICQQPRHLRAGTQADNAHDMAVRERGVKARPDIRGERNPQAKLTRQDVVAIRASKGKLREIAEQYGISVSQASKVQRGDWWKEV